MNSENQIEAESDDEELVVTWCEDGEGEEVVAAELVSASSRSETEAEQRDRSLTASMAMLAQVAVLVVIVFAGR